jgi:hypothetical protein
LTADPDELELMRKLTAETKARREEKKASTYHETCRKCNTTITVPSEAQQKMGAFLEKGKDMHGIVETYLQSEWVTQKVMDSSKSVEFKVTCPNPECRATNVIRVTRDVDVAG